jgi:hypothetical protein
MVGMSNDMKFHILIRVGHINIRLLYWFGRLLIVPVPNNFSLTHHMLPLFVGQAKGLFIKPHGRDQRWGKGFCMEQHCASEFQGFLYGF